MYFNHQEDESIDPNNFAGSVGLVDRIKKLVLSNFMVTASSISVIFITGYTCSCFSKRETLQSLKRIFLQEISKE